MIKHFERKANGIQRDTPEGYSKDYALLECQVRVLNRGCCWLQDLAVDSMKGSRA